MSPTRAEAFPGRPPVTPARVAHQCAYERFPIVLCQFSADGLGVLHGPGGKCAHRVVGAAVGTGGAPGATLHVTLGGAERSWPERELPDIHAAAIPRRMGTFQVQEAAD